SKQIYNLEEALNTALFERKNKTLVMTEQGEILLSCCHQVFGQLDECLIELSHPKNEKKQLVLSCEPTLSMKWLIPRLSKFKKLGHDFEVVLLTAGGVVDFEKDNIDIAIRRNDFDWGEHIYSEKIADEYIALVQATKPSETNDLLISTSRPNFFKNMSRIAELKQCLKGYTKVELEHFYLCLEGCLAGLGATVISIYMIEKELEWNAIQKISPIVQDNSAYFLLSHSAFEEDPRKTIFLEWLKAEMSEIQYKLL
ncbi:LysR family transcriptional regulator, partial [Acinetobacter seifertii]|uniref:LysR substrate-binding domain-containing protein n=1 Tax=Acinetobacter seifertii TaxID=1530123 RepID=UPI001580A6A6